MNPEKRILVVGEGLPVELFVVLVGDVVRVTVPERVCIVDRLGLRLFLLFAVAGGFGFALVAGTVFGNNYRLFIIAFEKILGVGEVDRVREGREILVEYFGQLVLFKELLRVFGEVHRDIRTAVLKLGVTDRKRHAVGGFPVYALGARNEGERVDFDLVGDHERGVKTETEVADNLVCVGFSFIFLNEVLGTGKSDLVYIFVDFFRGHADAVIGDRERARVLVENDLDLPLRVVLYLCFADVRELTKLADSVAGVGNDFSDENILFRVEPLLKKKKNIFGVDRHRAVSIFHDR